MYRHSVQKVANYISIQSASILASSQTLSYPKFPFVSLYDKQLSLQDVRIYQSTSDLQLDISLSMYLPYDIIDVLQAMRAYTITIEAYHEG